MRRFVTTFIALLALIMASSCTKQSYRISGEVLGNMIPGKVYLKVLSNLDEPKTIDSVELKDGKFTIKGSTKTPEFGIIQLSNDKIFPVILEKGNISFYVNLDDVANFKVRGTLSNDLFQDFRNSEKKFSAELEDLSQQYGFAQTNGTLTPLLDSTLNGKYKELVVRRNDQVAEFIKKHADNFASVVVLSQEQFNMQTSDFIPLFDLVQKNFPNSELVKEMGKVVDKDRKTEIGQPYINFTLPNTEGKDVKLSSFVTGSKLVLLDFWAAWCGPCRRENPNVVKLYSMYKDKGFQIVGVSLDDSKEQWLSAIAKDGITWPQLSDLKGWKSSAAELYGVKAIPATFLIYDGKIVAKNLRGKELENKVAELLK